MIERRNPRPDPATNQNGRDVSNTDDTITALNVKKVSRWNEVEIKLVHLKDGKIQGYLIGDGEAYAFWTHTYQNLEMKATHADEVRKRLIPGIHFIEVSKEEMDQIYPVIHEALMIRHFPSVFYFLTAEGFSRSLLEIDTSKMKNRDVAARIERRKDEIAHIYTLYQRGELVSPPDIKQISNKRNTSTDLSKQVARAVNEKIVPLYKQRGENPHIAFSRENRAINEITSGKHETDLKNHLNSTGLDIQIATKVSDITCLKAKILNDDTRWNHVKSVIDDIYPDRLSQNLKLTDREKALVSRKCDEKQKSIFEFQPSKQIPGAV